ncbi:ATP-binding cassette sub-family B member mitochondrial [Brachionus plicatilis]|uniref:ATP-binding cassette sub-family B member 10, mitochondrial n=1 Tax=Brachionus plicatilis TaxID=10195 RepID=A0A3M7R147_BRAPC|nr:ATP-binding cassette sub-family B member mitochondrial [Brachionus plicatilis]
MLFALKNLNNSNLIIKLCFRKNFNPFYSNLNTLHSRPLIKPNKKNLNFLASFIRSAKSSIKNENVQKIKKTEIRRLLSLAKPEKKYLAMAVLLLVVSSGVTMAVPFCIGKLIDFIQSGNKEEMKENLKKMTLIMGVIFLVGAFANFGRVYVIRASGQRIVTRLRQNLFQSIMYQDMAFFDKTKTGELVNRLSTDAEVVGLSISQNLSDGLRSAIQVSAGIGMMLYMSPQLSAYGLSIIPAVTVFAIIFGRYIKKISKRVQDVLASATDVAEEKLSNIRTVRAFAQEDKEISSYMKSIHDVLNMKYKEAFANGIFFGTTGLSGNLIILSVLYYGGVCITEQAMTVGDLSAFMIYSAWVGISMAGLSSFYTELMRGIGASTRIWEIIDREPAIPIVTKNKLNLTSDIFKNDIKFENVSFTYPTRREQAIFKNLDLVIPGGKVCAVVGQSGSGKSTLASLLLRLYDPEEGSIKIDNHDIRLMSQTWLRKHIGTVPQEPALFSMSIKENIAYGVPNPENITLEQIYQAAEQANAFSFIQQFPDKFDTLVGERGLNISGGQKQRIALARAILKDPKILLLDEATSALDSTSEFLVQEALERIMVNRTVIVIAHRLSTIKNADLIAVIDKGRIAELGTYKNLTQSNNGLFKQLVSRQTIRTNSD